MKPLFATSMLCLIFSMAFGQINRTEQKILERIDANYEESLSFLEKVVNINSGSLNIAGVQKVGKVFSEAFTDIGFQNTWVDLPAEMKRGGHLFSEFSEGKIKGKRLLLIGHLDTVFEEDSPFQTFRRSGDTLFGPGVADMKGGDVVILYALKALQEAGALKNAQIIVSLIGDEEKTGDPQEVSRKSLVDAAKRSDIALGFEGATGFNYATIARRGTASWSLETTGVRAHSAGVFRPNTGAGAIYEASRILTAFYEELQEEYLTYNPGLILGGSLVDVADDHSKGSAAGKTNVVSPYTFVKGDLRFLTPEQMENAKAKMEAIVSRHLPKTDATFTFEPGYPSMPPTAGNMAVLQKLSKVSVDLGQGEVLPFDPGRRGAGDISFVAAYVDALDGLGVEGEGAHTLSEWMDLKTFKSFTQRAALLIYRLIHEK
ncbi:MAG: M20/M25/M40 family metallo-hydrolase [Bacteroidetes bacterium]|nr:M20/M25/M40 family metallo-hydrolase [Bacteroidota bacterium]